MYYVLLVDAYGTIRQVKQFDTRPEAIEYIANLSDTEYMVILRNNNYARKTFPSY